MCVVPVKHGESLWRYWDAPCEAAATADRGINTRNGERPRIPYQHSLSTSIILNLPTSKSINETGATADGTSRSCADNYTYTDADSPVLHDQSHNNHYRLLSLDFQQ